MSRYLFIILLIFIISLIRPSAGFSEQEVTTVKPNQDSFLAVNSPCLKQNSDSLGVKMIIEAIVTAYSSSPEETDDTPFITASGSDTHYGIAAANFLPIGSKIRLPGIFGDQIFVIEDRLHQRYSDRIDIWMPNKIEAKEFGKQVGKIEIL